MGETSEPAQSSSGNQILHNSINTDNKPFQSSDTLAGGIVKETPLPWRQISILMAVRFAEPVGFTLLFPFVVFMVRDFKISSNESDVAFYAGLIASSFAISQVLSGVQWGILSDRIGRRPVLLLGLLGTAISLFLFGLSKSLPWAIATRSLCGLLNGNVGVVKSMMFELTDSTNRARGFSLLPLVFGLGSIIGPMLGGFLSNPVLNYPWLFNEGVIKGFLIGFPYFLPCFVSSMLCFSGLLFGALYLEETLEITPKTSNYLIQNLESTRLIHKDNSESTLCNYKSLLETKDTESSPSQAKFYIPRNDSEVELGKDKEVETSIPKASWVAMIGYAGLSLQFVMLDELIPFWASALVVKGGLGFLSPDIGILMIYSGIALMVIQIMFYSPIQRKLGTLALYQRVFPIYAPVILLHPLASSIAALKSPYLLWGYLIFITTWKTGAAVFGFTSINILVAETCPNKKLLGKVNGLNHVFGSLMRAVGPALTGLAFSWSQNNENNFILLSYPFTWIMIFLICIVNHFIALNISPSAINI